MSKHPMKLFAAIPLLALAAVATAAHACDSQVTLTIKSSNYSGPIDIQLRKGQRPGSKLASASAASASRYFGNGLGVERLPRQILLRVFYTR